MLLADALAEDAELKTDSDWAAPEETEFFFDSFSKDTEFTTDSY